METEVKRRIIADESALTELSNLLSKLSDFDALRAHFLLDALLSMKDKRIEYLRQLLDSFSDEVE